VDQINPTEWTETEKSSMPRLQGVTYRNYVCRHFFWFCAAAPNEKYCKNFRGWGRK